MTETITKNMATTMTMTAFFLLLTQVKKTKQEFNLHSFFKK